MDDFDLYDVDDNDYLSFPEYNDALYYTYYFDTWDVDLDSNLSQFELADQVFNNRDLNDNKVMNRSEFNHFDFYYADV